jgi:hypothetical protein
MTPKEELRQIKLAQIGQKREAVARARRLATQFFSIEDRNRALQFAEELDAQAEELERALADEPPGQATQIQAQVQQQGPPANDDPASDDKGDKRDRDER